MKGKMLKWVQSFLADRKKIVEVEVSQSESKVMLSGVPEGSCLVPLLFITCFDDVDACLKHEIMLKYAEDVKIYHSFSHTALIVSISRKI